MIAPSASGQAIAGIRTVSGLFARLTKRAPTGDKPVWGRRSLIELLADTLAKQPQGWVLEPNAIRRNGVVIGWRGSLDAARTTLAVTMDGKRYRITAGENAVLKQQVVSLLRHAS